MSTHTWDRCSRYGQKIAVRSASSSTNLKGRRQMLKRFFVRGFFFLALVGCQPSPPTGPPTPNPPMPSSSGVALGEEFTLYAGEFARIKGEDIAIHFEEVTEDSRCPITAECVWAGQAVVAISVTEGDAHFGEVNLTIMA